MSLLITKNRTRFLDLRHTVCGLYVVHIRFSGLTLVNPTHEPLGEWLELENIHVRRYRVQGKQKGRNTKRVWNIDMAIVG